MKPKKITLGDAEAQGEYWITLQCVALGDRCHHEGKRRLSELLARFGPDARLDQIPARCEACGERERIDVRARRQHRLGGHAVGPFDPGDA